MQKLQEKLYRGEDLSSQESFDAFGQIVKGQQDPINISAFLVSLKIKGEKPHEVAGAARALRTEANLFSKPDYKTADSCGTGGSGKHTLNISTLVAFIGSIAGLKMIKHGNRSISSQCGSADVLEYLGIKIDMSSTVARKCLDTIGITFLFAPMYHSGVRHVTPVRNALKTRTIFNLLGPLINPASPESQLMGVYSQEQCYSAAESLRLSGCQNAMVVHSCGCDEITLAGKTHVAHLRDGKITEYDLMPEDFGLADVSLNVLVGGTPEENARQFVELLQGKSAKGIVDIVAANAGALIYLTGLVDNLKQGVIEAKKIINSGQAYNKLLDLVEISQSKENDND